MNRFWLILVFGSLLLGIWSCETSKSVSGRNISHLYLENHVGRVDVQYRVLHLGEGKTKISWEIDRSTLELAEDESGRSTMSVVFRYRLYYNYGTSVPVDSASLILKEVAVTSGLKEIGSFVLDVAKDRNHLLEITVRDLNSLGSNHQYLDIVKSQQFSRQSFSLLDHDGMSRTTNYVTKADSYLIETNSSKPYLVARFYARDFPMAAAPFAIVNPRPFDFNPDKQFKLPKVDSNQFKLYVTQNGFYQILDDSLSKVGGTIYYFGEHYPRAKTVNDLLMPLRYITTSQEFDKISTGENIKKSIDAYWLKIGGNQDRARMLIQSYYSRVEAANELFSSYLEGWKSDRGMCYIVFGPPSQVYRSTSSETWYYGEAGKYNTLTLTFTKVINPFTNNDFRLNRNGSLKSPWYRAVEFWRQGRVITYQQ